MLLTRRTLLSSTAAALAAPIVLTAQPSWDVDTVVIGAGAAGLAAARTVAAQGRSYAVLEARDRIGGRAFTDTLSLGVPYDQGAHWLHSVHKNPFVQIAKDLGRTLTPSPLSDLAVFENGAPLPDGPEAIGRAEGRLTRRLVWNSLWRDDFAPTEIGLPDRWQRAVADIAAFTMAVDTDRMSVDDFAALEGGEDYVVRGGYGALVAAHGAHIAVRLRHPVRIVRWGQGGGVTVSGDFGTLRGRICIVSVPSSVLADEAIRFDPPLPDAKRAAFENLRGGHFLKVGMKLPAVPREVPEYAWDIGRARGGKGLGFHFDRTAPIATMIGSGSMGEGLAAMNRDDLFALARRELGQVAGSALANSVEAFATHDWFGDPFARGAYSVRRLGAGSAREDYAAPVGNRLFFAGEAAGSDLAVTVAGAHLSGVAAAEESAEG